MYYDDNLDSQDESDPSHLYEGDDTDLDSELDPFNTYEDDDLDSQDESDPSHLYEVERNESLQRAEEVRRSLGDFELEVSFGGEADLQTQYTDCKKNPGHKDFIPVKMFNMSHLPKQFASPKIVDIIKNEAQLTVRIKTNFVSLNRPEKIPGTDVNFPLSKYRGQEIQRTGTGQIKKVLCKHTPDDPPEKRESCPCNSCWKSGNLNWTWGMVEVTTATHVVFDTKEARRTECELFFDSDEDRHEKRIQKMFGVRVKSKRGNVKSDACTMHFVSHDLELIDKLSEMQQRRRQLSPSMFNKYKKGRPRNKLTVIISHPHGCSKQISVGKWVRRKVTEGDSRYDYSTSTCRGSSGAPVFICGNPKWWYAAHRHSSGNSGENTSTGTFFI